MEKKANRKNQSNFASFQLKKIKTTDRIDKSELSLN